MKLSNEYVENWLRDYMSDPEKNTMKVLPGPAFDLPSVGFSRADDPLYSFYQQHIDPAFYRRPEQWLESIYGHSFDPARVSVISWVLPQTADTRAKSRASTDCPTMEWQMARVHGEECNRNMDKALEEHFVSLGYEAVAPMCSPEFSWGKSEQFTLNGKRRFSLQTAASFYSASSTYLRIMPSNAGADTYCMRPGMISPA